MSASVAQPIPAHNDDDQVIVARIRAGDAAAFEQVFRAQYAGLRRFLVQHVRSVDLADELLQDLFLRLWADRASWEVTGTIRTYLYQAARNRALNYLRHARIETRHSDDESSAPPFRTVATPSEELDSRELADAARAIVAQLPPRCRMVYTLSRQHGLSYNEIATILEIAPRTVAVHMENAFRQLRRGLAPFLAAVIVAITTMVS